MSAPSTSFPGPVLFRARYAFRRLYLYLDARHPYDLVRPRCNRNAGGIELRENHPAHRVLDPSHPALRHEEANRQLQPIVGELPEDARLEIRRVDEIVPPELPAG